MNGLTKVLTGCVAALATVAVVGYGFSENRTSGGSSDQPVLKAAAFTVSGNKVGDYPALKLDIENASGSSVYNCRMTWHPGALDSTKPPEILHSEYFSLEPRAAMGFAFVAHTAHRISGWSSSQASVSCDGVAGLDRSERLYVE